MMSSSMRASQGEERIVRFCGKQEAHLLHGVPPAPGEVVVRMQLQRQAGRRQRLPQSQTHQRQHLGEAKWRSARAP